jgi:hypothetical protein
MPRGQSHQRPAGASRNGAESRITVYDAGIAAALDPECIIFCNLLLEEQERGFGDPPGELLMDYLGSYRFVFRSRNWAMNLLFAVLCSLIPAIGPIVLMGYFFEVIEYLIRRRQRGKAFDYPPEAISEPLLDALPVDSAPDSESYPDFTFDRFSEYLSRGIWPFLLQLIVGLVLGAASAFLWIVGMVTVGVASGGKSGVLPLIFFVVFFVCYIVLAIVLGALKVPLYLRAGLSGDFASAFSMDFYRDFLKRIGKEVVLAQLFLTVSSLLVFGVGALVCCVGIYPAIALVLFARHHLDYQLYELYLERDGTPIERKQTRADMPPREVEEERSTDIMRPERDEW